MRLNSSLPNGLQFQSSSVLLSVIMASLNEQLNSFKKQMRNAPVLPQKRVVDQQSTGHSRESSPSPKKAKKANFVYSQPASTGMGTHSSTQLVHAVEYVKKQDKPIKLSDLEGYLSFPIAPLLPLLRNIDRIKINERDRTIEYVSIYNIYSAEDLLAFLRAQSTFQGVPVKQLKDGWSGCLDAIEELEKKQDILVLRTKKENLPRYVWANRGGPIHSIDTAFTDLWAKAKVPTASELPGALEKLGLKPTSVDPATVKKVVKPTETRKQKKPRRGKITNTHMRGVLKDYSM